jgi:hypothetical protein
MESIASEIIAAAASPAGPNLTGTWTLSLRRSEKLGPVLQLLGLRGFGTYMAEMMGETLTIAHDQTELKCCTASLFSTSEDRLAMTGEVGSICFGGEQMSAVARWVDAGTSADDRKSPAHGAPTTEVDSLLFFIISYT